jgi:hypothetical protein
VRTIINMAFASAADLERQITHETMDGLWSYMTAENTQNDCRVSRNRQLRRT